MRRRALLVAASAIAGTAVVGCGPRQPTWGPEAYPNGLEYQPSEPPAVTMYMTPWCPVCRQARRWLEERQEVFVERDVEADEGAARRFLALNPRGTVPTFVIDGRVYVGFDRRALHEALRALRR